MKLLASVTVVFIYLFAIRMLNSSVRRLGEKKLVDAYRLSYIRWTLNLCISFVFIVLLSLTFGIEYSQISLFLSSVFAVIGVALFAQWSILSNVTASVIIFFAFPYRVGDQIRVVGDDENISGRIEEITLFHVLIRRESDLITYPNSVILQKAVIKEASVSRGPQALEDSLPE